MHSQSSSFLHPTGALLIRSGWGPFQTAMGLDSSFPSSFRYVAHSPTQWGRGGGRSLGEISGRSQHVNAQSPTTRRKTVMPSVDGLPAHLERVALSWPSSTTHGCSDQGGPPGRTLRRRPSVG
ncbi:hypothetical protein RJ55_03344 [Drechmeria coniospora]|nr:hypothetical protein RJ55_03344 [Drechmeria coniospora]